MTILLTGGFVVAAKRYLLEEPAPAGGPQGASAGQAEASESTVRDAVDVVRDFGSACTQIIGEYFAADPSDERENPARAARDPAIVAQEDALNTKLVVAAGSTVVTGTAVLGGSAALFALVGVPAMAFLMSPILADSYRAISRRERFVVPTLDALALVSTVLTGQLFAASLGAVFIYGSKKLLLKTQDHSRKDLVEVFGDRPEFVWRLIADVEVRTYFSDLKPGDIIVVHAGESIPVDGLVVAGTGMADQCALTGESQPVEVCGDQRVMAATTLIEGRIAILVEHAGADTIAAKIASVLNNTDSFVQSVRSRGEAIVEQGAIPTLLLAAATLPMLGAQSACAVLFTSFGYHMRIAAPIGVLNFLKISSEHGILLKDGRALEGLGGVDVVVFDKTGTLTEGVPTVAGVYAFGDATEFEVLANAAAAESRQSHPIALAIRGEAERREIPGRPADTIALNLGNGLCVKVGDDMVYVGSARYMASLAIDAPEGSDAVKASAHALGHTVVYVAVQSKIIGMIEIAPTIRPEAHNIVRRLRARGVATWVVSGDHEAPTSRLAAALGIDAYRAEVLPQDKAAFILELQDQGKTVCFVGDGINDSIALKQANVSISLSGAATAATDSASIILMDGTLRKLLPLLDISARFEANLKRGTVLTLIPGFAALGGVFLFHAGLATAIMLYNVGLLASVTNAMVPLVEHRRETKVRGIREVTAT